MLEMGDDASPTLPLYYLRPYRGNKRSFSPLFMKLTSQAYEVNILFRAILVGQPRGLGYPPFSVYRVALNIMSILFTELFHLIPIDAILLDEPNEVFGIVFSVMGETNEEILFLSNSFNA